MQWLMSLAQECLHWIFFPIQWLLSCIQPLMESYGYWIIFFGAMIEGESIILTASALVSKGTLSIYYVGLVTFLGTLIADQSIYLLGTLYGLKTLTHLKKRFHFMADSIDRGLGFLKKNETIYILSFRFIYGIRIVSPFIIGAQHVSFWRFSFLNIIAAFIWTVISCSLGYFLGHAFRGLTEHIGLIVAMVLVTVFVSSALLSRIRARIRKKP